MYKNKHKPPQVILKYQKEKCIRNKDLNSLVGVEDIWDLTPQSRSRLTGEFPAAHLNMQPGYFVCCWKLQVSLGSWSIPLPHWVSPQLWTTLFAEGFVYY